MASEVKLPRLGQGMETGTVVKWLKSEGDPVEKGELLFEVETDKATQEIEAETSGILLKIAVQSGEVPVGHTVGVIGESGETVDVTAPAAPAATPVAPGDAPGPEAPDAEPGVTVSATDNGDRVKASPLARRIARERGIDLTALIGNRARRAGSSPRTSSARRRPLRPRPRRLWPRRSLPARSSQCR